MSEALWFIAYFGSALPFFAVGGFLFSLLGTVGDNHRDAMAKTPGAADHPIQCALIVLLIYAAVALVSVLCFSAGTYLAIKAILGIL